MHTITPILLALAFCLMGVTACQAKPNKHNSSSSIVPIDSGNAVVASAQPDTSALTEWKAGTVVTPQAIETYGESRCFVVEPVSKAVFARMKGKSYKHNCTIPLSELRYVKVIHCNAEGKPQLGELVCNRRIAADLVDIFRNLYRAHYRIERMVLIDDYDADDELSMLANNTACFNFRTIAGTNKLSNHSQGCAIDINPLYNPYVWHDKSGHRHVDPSTAAPYADRSKKFAYKIDTSDLCYREFIRHGFQWGGSWQRRKDYQHFEKK